MILSFNIFLLIVFQTTVSAKGNAISNFFGGKPVGNGVNAPAIKPGTVAAPGGSTSFYPHALVNNLPPSAQLSPAQLAEGAFGNSPILPKRPETAVKPPTQALCKRQNDKCLDPAELAKVQADKAAKKLDEALKKVQEDIKSATTKKAKDLLKGQISVLNLKKIGISVNKPAGPINKPGVNTGSTIANTGQSIAASHIVPLGQTRSIDVKVGSKHYDNLKKFQPDHNKNKVYIMSTQRADVPQSSYKCEIAGGLQKTFNPGKFSLGMISRGRYNGDKLNGFFSDGPAKCQDYTSNAKYQHFDIKVGKGQTSEMARSFYRVFSEDVTGVAGLISVSQTDGSTDEKGAYKVQGVAYLYCGIAAHKEGKNNGFFPCNKAN